jgi:ABC-type transport system substrate-binding protein
MFFRNRKSLLARFALILALLSGWVGGIQAEPVRAATFTVTNTNDSGSGSLRDAIAAAVGGDILTFDPALAGQIITLSSSLTS